MTNKKDTQSSGLTRKTLSACIALFVSTAGVAHADGFPSEPVSIIVAWPAGGSHDRVARMVSDYLAEELSQPIVVINQEGAAGTTGVRAAASADPDGYTIGVMGLHVVAQTYMNQAAAALDSIAPLALIETSPAAISVRAETGITSLDELVAAIEADPEAILNSNDGPGGFANNSAMLIQEALGVEFLTIPYQGYSPAIAAITSGETNASTIPTALMTGLAESGDVNILGVAGAERHFRAPDVPTFTEQGYPLVFEDFVGFFLPAGVPEDRAAILEQAVMNVLANEDFLATARQAGSIIAPEDSEGFAAFLEVQDNTVYPILERSGLVVARER